MVASARWAVVAITLAGIVVVYGRWLHANATTAALTLLLLILLLASKWGLRYAVVASLAATVCYNFFFLPPVGTFTIQDPQNWLALLAFLATATIASRLSARIREEARQAHTRQRETEMLLRLSRELLQSDRVEELLGTLPASLVKLLGASSVLLYLEEGGRTYRAGSSEAPLPDLQAVTEWALLPSVARVGDGSSIAVPLRVGVKPRGVLLIEPVPLSSETFEAMSGLISIAIDRAQALEHATRSEAAKESERLRSIMLDSITHELRTPLTSIKAAVSTLLSPEAVSQTDTQELLTVVDEESDRLNQLLTQAVEMARLETQEVQMRTQPLRVDLLLSGAVRVCGSRLEGRNVRVEAPPGLPPVEADAEWLPRVLSNLLENAAKYSAPGQPIVLRAEQRDAAVSISVADQGVGIAPAEQELIFRKFYRSPSQVQRVPGTGMGLAICRAILDAHGSELTVASSPGVGSTFTFTLPISTPVSARRTPRSGV